MDLFSVDIGYVLLLRTASDSCGDGALPYGIALRKMGRVRLERAYSPKVWLAMRYGLRGRSTIAASRTPLWLASGLRPAGWPSPQSWCDCHASTPVLGSST